MKRIYAIGGIAGIVAAAAVAGGVGVAFAHDGPGDDDAGHMMDAPGTGTHMHAGTMQEHMEDALGPGAWEGMEGAMRQILGEDGYQQMLDRMETECDQPGMEDSMMGAVGSSHMPDHQGHHDSADE